MSASIARRPRLVSWLPSLGRMTSALTFWLISVSTAAICCATSLVGFTGAKVTSGYCSACAFALFAMAAIQPWSAAGAEKPMVTGAPGVALSPAAAPTLAPEPLDGASLLVQAATVAAAPTPSAARKPRRPRPPGSRDSDMALALLRGRRPGSGGGRAPGAGLDQHRDDDDRALGDVLDLDGEVVQHEQVGDHGEHQDAEDRADQGPATAGEQGAADDHGGDRVELVERAVGARARRGERGDHDRGDAAAEARHHVEQDGVPPHVHTGQPRGLGVATDRERPAAEGGAVEHDPADGDDHGEDVDEQRDAED